MLRQKIFLGKKRWWCVLSPPAMKVEPGANPPFFLCALGAFARKKEVSGKDGHVSRKDAKIAKT
jgi:hypothetical protein